MVLIDWISWILLGGYVLLILAYWMGWEFIKPFVLSKGTKPKYRYSVLVPCRNEQEVILKCLNDIAAQNYDLDLFEVIVIDDHSTDDTAEKVNQFIQSSKLHIQLVRMTDDPAQRKLKKQAITYGISKAQHDYIILTDADCERGAEWLQSIDGFMQRFKPKMVYAPVEFKANSIFEKIQSLEFAGLVGIGASAIQLKNPNMCSAANLIFEKQIFFDVEGYKGYDGMASGDDEFLMHKVFKKFPNDVRFLKSKEALVHTSPNASVKQLTDQRRRWVSKSTKYENRYITAILVAAYLFNALLLFNLLVHPLQGLGMIGIKMFFEGLFLWSVLRFFNRSSYLLYLPLAEFFHILYVLIIGIWAQLGTYQWKGRKVN